MKEIHTIQPVKPGFDLNFNFKNFKIFAPLFALILCAALFVPSALAADTDDPFMGFMETLAAPEEDQNNAAALQTTTAGSGLSGVEKEIYDALSAKIRRIAYGKEESSVIEITDITEKNMETLMNAITKAVNALLSDFPYELYWFDKTEGYQIQYKTDFDQETNTLLVNITMSMTVAEAYRADDGSDKYKFNTELAAAAQTAANNARAIVNLHASKSDYEKIKAYKQEIRDLTDYNDDAAENSNTPYGDPWQIIYVFDKNPETKVVCEGYAKAFQYLCDLSLFMGGTESRIVTGRYLSDISGRTSGGKHMWNHVRLEDKWYLADITNCDGEDGASVTAVGYPDYLFLRGGVTPDSSDYNYAVSFEKSSQNITVSYKIDTDKLVYADRAFLTLSTEDYEPDVMAERVLTAADFRVTDQQDPTQAPKLDILHDGNPHGVGVSWVSDDMSEQAGTVSAAYALYSEEDGIVSYGPMTPTAPTEIGVYQIYANVAGNSANGYAQIYIPLAQRISILSDRASTLNPDSTQTLTFGNSQSGSVSVVLLDMNGEPIASARITAALENQSDSALITLTRTSFSTDENGAFSVPFTTGDKEEGTAKIICEFAGDDDHDGSSCEIEIKIQAFAAISVEGTGEQASVTVTTTEQDLLRVPVFVAAYSAEGQLLGIAQNTIRSNDGALSATAAMDLTGAARLRAFFVDSDGSRANIPLKMPVTLDLNGASEN